MILYVACRSLYNRLFGWLVDLCNRTLIDPTMKKVIHLIHQFITLVIH